MSVGPKDAAKQKGKDGAALVKTMVARSALGALTIDGRALVVNLAVARTDAVRVRRGTAQHAHAISTRRRIGWCGGALRMHRHAVLRWYWLCGHHSVELTSVGQPKLKADRRNLFLAKEGIRARPCAAVD